MIIKKSSDLKEHEVTDEAIYQQRRTFIKAMGAGSILLGSGLGLNTLHAKIKQSELKEKATSLKYITNYNNFYEFGTRKTDPAKHAHKMPTSPWSVQVDGECAKPGTITLEDILKPVDIEERIYRLRCVEGWSMVIPWMGFPLVDLLKRFEPTSKAKYVYFETLADKKYMRGVKRKILDWPYTEGLRMDEAMHPLTLLATGLYGKEELPNQNGAPLRLVVPWKYGFKSIKSIVKISFLEEQPLTLWQQLDSSEYGFYSNVNPKVSHPRWSQKRERRIGEFRKRKTLMFNGYEDQVAHLYKGMDLKKHF